MSNPWLKKNPFMSLWLSGFHRVAGSARAQVVAEATRQLNAAVAQATGDKLKRGSGTLAAKRPRVKSRTPGR